MGTFDRIWRRKGRPNNSQESLSEDNPEYMITGTDRDHSSILDRDDVAIKIWLPELMGAILEEICDYMNASRSDIIRQTLFTYLYGRYDWLAILERKENSVPLKTSSGLKFSVSSSPSKPDMMRDMGKNTEDLKVWVPNKVKEDIQNLAQQANISISEMIREIIISTMIGHTYLSARKELLQMNIEIEEETSSE